MMSNSLFLLLSFVWLTPNMLLIDLSNLSLKWLQAINFILHFVKNPLQAYKPDSVSPVSQRK